MKKIMMISTVLIAVFGSESQIAYAQQKSVTLTAKARQIYYRGLPLIIKADIVNVSEEVKEVLLPSAKTGTLTAKLKKDGQNSSLTRNEFRTYIVVTNQFTNLEPKTSLTASIDLKAFYAERDLLGGKYWCELTYVYGKEAGEVIVSNPVSFVITEPQDSAMKAAMNEFIGAKVFFDQSRYEEATKKFEEIGAAYKQNDYGKASFYYAALSYMNLNNYTKVVPLLKRYLQNLPADMPDLKSPEDIQLMLGIAYYQSKDFSNAKKVLIGLANANPIARLYLKKIDEIQHR